LGHDVVALALVPDQDSQVDALTNTAAHGTGCCGLCSYCIFWSAGCIAVCGSIIGQPLCVHLLSLEPQVLLGLRVIQQQQQLRVRVQPASAAPPLQRLVAHAMSKTLMRLTMSRAWLAQGVCWLVWQRTTGIM
jgi:hypothetical protein